MSELLADIDFRTGGNSNPLVREGWAEEESTHRWTMGRESRLVLPVSSLGPDCVLVINATPCVHPPELPGQAVMISLNGRLLAAASFPGLRVFAYRIPPGFADAAKLELSIYHLSWEASRAPEQVRRGEPLGLAVHSIRIFRLTPPGTHSTREGVDSPQALAMAFESIGQGCHFGQMQRKMGAEPVSLLRFVDSVTSGLVEGLIRGFAGIDVPERLLMGQATRSRPSHRWHQLDYDLFFDTMIFLDEADAEEVRQAQARRLRFLRTKFLEDVRNAEKIFVLTRNQRLTEPEALAVFCALSVYGPNRLLWTVQGDASSAGRVDVVMPGFVCGHLGLTDQDGFASLEIWVQVLKESKNVLF